MKHWLLILAACLTLGLAACGSDKSDKPDSDADKSSDSAENHNDKAAKVDDDKSKFTPICPQVAIVAPLDHIRDYGDEKPEPSQLVAEAKLIDLQGTCAYQDDGIDVTYDLNMAARRGPRLGGLHTSFPFFTAVVDPDGNILNKEPMTAEFSFASDEQISRRAESLHVFIPLAKEDQVDGPNYRVLMGFQVPDGQLNTGSK